MCGMVAKVKEKRIDMNLDCDSKCSVQTVKDMLA